MEFCWAKFSKSVVRTLLKFGLSVVFAESNMGRNVFLSGTLWLNGVVVAVVVLLLDSVVLLPKGSSFVEPRNEGITIQVSAITSVVSQSD